MTPPSHLLATLLGDCRLSVRGMLFKDVHEQLADMLLRQSCSSAVCVCVCVCGVCVSMLTDALVVQSKMHLPALPTVSPAIVPYSTTSI